MPPKYKHINSASRVHAILSSAIAQPDKAAWGVWADVFAVKGADDTETAELVFERLLWLQLEVQVLQAQTRGAGLSEHLYASAFARIRSSISALTLPSGWQGIKGNLTPDVLVALAFLNEMLPDEESAISEEDLQQIKQQVAELGATLKEENVPEGLRRLVEHHLTLIAQALAQYRIFGARALREAGRTALGEIIEQKDTVEGAKQTETVTRLGKLWKKVNSAADAALKAEKLAQLGHKAWEAVSGLLS